MKPIFEPIFEPITTKDHAPSNDQPIVMLELEQELVGPDGARLCEDYINQFKHHLTNIQSIQRSGLSPNQFSQSEALRTALESAVRYMSLNRSLVQ